MKMIFVGFLFFAFFSGTANADPVAVFDVQWGKGKARQMRSFAIAFDDVNAPLTSVNFRKLVKDRFYLKTGFHRAFPNYLVQGGDPLSRKKDRSEVGTGGPGYTLRAEIHRKHVRSAVAMGRLPDNVNANRQSNGSQFYICLRPIPSEDGKDTVFGEVVSGLDAVDEMSRLLSDTNGNPLEKIEVRRTYLIDRGELGTRAKIR
jgi:peptidyl-prolyl cis-trans isomerase B (cyclophilin B)